MVGDEVRHVVVLDPLRIIFPGNAAVNSLPLAIGTRCNYEFESFYPFFSTTSMSKKSICSMCEAVATSRIFIHLRQCSSECFHVLVYYH